MLEDSVDEWRNSLTQYKESKTKLAWNTNQPVKYITEKMKKDIEAQYDPILQKYTDEHTEQQVRAREQEDLVRTLAQNKVLLSSR